MFRDEFKSAREVFTVETNKTPEESKVIFDKLILESKLEQIKKDLRKAGIKIKNISPTNFGTEIIFFSKSDAIDASEVINTNKVKDNSVFVA